MTKNNSHVSYLTGSLANRCLIAMPNMGDDGFEGSVVYICSHSDKDGAVGLVINKPCPLPLGEILKQTGINYSEAFSKMQTAWGGPVDPARGFILHSADYVGFETTALTDELSLTVSVDVLSKIALGQGPENALLALGYSSWGAGQLELEIAGNSWLVFEPDTAYLFKCPAKQKWKTALGKIGIDPLMLSLEQGSV